MICSDNAPDLMCRDAEEAMLAQAITASLIESEPDLKAVRQSEIEAAGAAQPLHTPDQPPAGSSPPEPSQRSLQARKWTSVELGVTPSPDLQSTPHSTDQPEPWANSAPTQSQLPHIQPAQSPPRSSLISSRPGSAAARRRAVAASPRLSQVLSVTCLVIVLHAPGCVMLKHGRTAIEIFRMNCASGALV